ncbi:hypothetical protein C8R43DRAFT_1085855 [Mycena crocata]|nr:hypothetical protein C8R43DRAFT_1085855 [Mycena crocata]
MLVGIFTLCLILAALLPVKAAVGRCSHPAIRKEWRSLSRQEREKWITAVKCLANTPNTKRLVASVNPPDIAPYNASGSLFDDLVYAHMDQIHMTGLFLPWHRWWLGSPSSQFRVLDGGFSASSSFRLSNPYPHTLRRNFTLFPPLQVLFPPGFVWNHSRPGNASLIRPVVESLIDGFVGDYKGFQARMDSAEWVGNFPKLRAFTLIFLTSDMGGVCPIGAPAGCVSGPTFSSNDPLFWMHHMMLDRIWFKWQKKHKLNRYAFEGGSVQRLETTAAFGLYPTGGPPDVTISTHADRHVWKMDSAIPTDGLSGSFIVRDFMSSTGGPLCYVYD